MTHRTSPTDRQRMQVERLIACGTPLEEIATLFGMSLDDLKSLFTREIETSGARAVSEVIGEIYAEAMAGDLKAIAIIRKQNRKRPDLFPMLDKIARQ